MNRFAAFFIVSILVLTAFAFIRNPQSSAKTAVRSACANMVFEADSFTVCRYDPSRHRLQLILSDNQKRPLRSFAALRGFLGTKSSKVAFAMNAGMYDTAGNPIGLYVEGGQTRHAINLRNGSGNFHLMPNGVFWIDRKGAAISDSASFDIAVHPELQLATQSGPMLVIDGKLHPKFSRDGTSRYIRNGVGIDPNGQPVFAISTAPVSLGKFARLFRDGLNCRNALFLDGYVSSLWDGASGRSDTGNEIGPMVVVSEAG